MDPSTRSGRWLRRESMGALSFASEHWADTNNLHGYRAWKLLADSRGWDSSEESLRHEMTAGLLREAIYAAGGVETELSRLEGAVATAQAWANETWPRGSVGASSIGGAPAIGDGFYTFINLLGWARTVTERVDRPGRGDPLRAGLLPALAAKTALHDRVAQAHRILLSALVEVRFLANYALHAGALHGGGTPSANLLVDGTVVLRLPDPIDAPVTTWHQFEYSQGRDVLTFSYSVMTSVETFVDEVLAAFEAARPARFGPL